MSKSYNCETCQDDGEHLVYTYLNSKTLKAQLKPCTECCPHDEHDHGICLDCGLDRTDYFVGKAEDYYEGER